MSIRITKLIANNRLYSRRQAEQLVLKGKVSVNGKTVRSPALLVSLEDDIKVQNDTLNITNEQPKIWLFHKPTGCLTTKEDPAGRTTIYHLLPKKYQSLLYVGRLDYNSEGLLLLTNNGDLSNYLTKASNKIVRQYKVKTFGKISQPKLDKLKNGVTINKVKYSPTEVKLISQNNLQSWLSFTLTEGKNNEIRNICQFLGLTVRRLIRTSYGKFELGDLPKGKIYKASSHTLNSIYPPK